MNSSIVWIVVAVVALFVIAVLVGVLMNNRKQAKRRGHAEELRREAEQHAPAVGSAHADAREKELRAEEARLAAERAEREAAQARVGAQQEAASHEDRLREADRVDPDVDHRDPDYEPGARPADEHVTETHPSTEPRGEV